jgi:hypothetical protein
MNENLNAPVMVEEVNGTPAPDATAPASNPPVVARPKMSALGSRKSLVLPDPVLPGSQQREPGQLPVPDDTPDKEPLPTNYMLCFPIRARLLEMLRTSRNPGQQAALRSRLLKLATHINELQNGPRYPEIDLNKLRAAQGAAIGGSEQARQTRLARLASTKADPNYWAILSIIIPDRELEDVWADFICGQDAQDKIIQLRDAQINYEMAFLEHWSILNPLSREKERQRAVISNPSKEALQKILEEEYMFASKNFRLIASAKAAQLHGLWHETVKPKTVTLLEDAVLFLNERKLSALAEEAELLKAHGAVSTGKSALARRYDDFLASVNHYLNALVKPPHGGTPMPSIGFTALPVEGALQSIFATPILPAPEHIAEFAADLAAATEMENTLAGQPVA